MARLRLSSHNLEVETGRFLVCPITREHAGGTGKIALMLMMISMRFLTAPVLSS